MKIRGRLLLTHVAVALAILLGVEIVLFAAARTRLESLVLEELHGSAALVDQAIATAKPADARELDALADRFGEALGSRVTLITRAGTVVADSEVPFEALASIESHLDRPEVADAFRDGRGSSQRTSTTVRTDMLYTARRTADGRVVRIARPMTHVADTVSAARRAILVLGAFATAAAALLAFAVSSRLARPIVEITDAARAMAGGDLERRTDTRGDGELAALAHALNDLARSFAASIAQVTEERNRIAGVLAGMVEGVLVTDALGRVVLVNPSLREIFGITSDLGRRQVLEVVRSAELHEWVSTALAGAETTARVLTVHGPPERTMEVRFSILRDEGRVAGLVAVLHDVTELKRLEQVRRDFVANASHELKTPVAAILGATETLESGALSDPAAGPRFLSAIQRNATRLAALVEDLLDLSRLEARGAGEALREVRPLDALSRAAAQFRDQAAEKSISLTVADSSGAGAVRGDPGLVDRALTNLVQNAVRYTPKGGRVLLRAVQLESSVRFEVEDDGIGIPTPALSRIFERFYRVDPARSRELGGTGLGLAIVKHAVESMGGTIDVRSEPGKGSTFSFTLPVWDA